LLIVGWVPVGVEEHEAVTADEVDPASPSLGREQKHEAVLRWVVEFLDQLLSLADAGAAVQSADRVPVFCAQRLDQVEGLRVVADYHDAVLRFFA
tara:strand:- start:102 stop:386 length:285 start_codon:yes stop_codon:yes gene_type:complete